MLTCLVPVLFTFYIQGVLNLKKNNSGAKGLSKIKSMKSKNIISAGFVNAKVRKTVTQRFLLLRHCQRDDT